MPREKPISKKKIKEIADKAEGGITAEPGKRPLEFKQTVADIICDRIADGQSLREICRDENMPASSTVFKWLTRVETFAEQYALAREAQADALFDEILEIADDGSNDWMERKGEDGTDLGWKENGEALRRSQLRVDARKWMAGKLRPKKYGEKVTLAGDADNPIGPQVIQIVAASPKSTKRKD
jgi:hypothetical protein